MNRTRPKQIVIRVSEEELAQIKKKVEQSGKSQQQYIIEALTQKQVINTDGIKEIYPELKRQGNNLNQIAKKLNENGYSPLVNPDHTCCWRGCGSRFPALYRWRKAV